MFGSEETTTRKYGSCGEFWPSSKVFFGAQKGPIMLFWPFLGNFWYLVVTDRHRVTHTSPIEFIFGGGRDKYVIFIWL